MKDIKNMNDTEKLKALVKLLRKEDNISMFTESSDMYGVDFTEEYEEWQEELYDFLDNIDLQE